LVILLPYVLQAILRYRTLRMVFAGEIRGRHCHPLIAALLATMPALVCRVMIGGVAGQIIASGAFLLVYGGAWLYYRRAELSRAN
jgi:hypothetical protein